MGLKSSPAELQRFMEECLGDYRDSFCAPYLDDIIFYSKSFEEHVLRLGKVLCRLREKGVKLQPEKYRLFQKEVKYIGRVILEEGHKIDLEGIKPILKLRGWEPKTIGDLRRVMGLLGYYRGYIPDFPRIAKPLYDLLKVEKEENNYHKGEKVKGVKEKHKQKQKSSTLGIDWIEVHRIAFQKLTDCHIKSAIMAYPDFSKPFLLHVDASQEGLGAVLYQHQIESNWICF